MKRDRSPLMARVRWQIARLHLGPAIQIESFDSMPFISSSGPRIVIVLAALGAGVTSAAAAWQVFAAGQIPWVLFALGFAHAVVALAGSLVWKRVQCGERHYVVSDSLKSETISFDDVCMVVEAPGFLWNTVHIHLRRPSRFGWSVAFVPRRAGGRTPSMTEQRLKQAR